MVVSRFTFHVSRGALLCALLAGCAHQSYEPAPAHVQPPVGQWTFEDCELADDGSTVPRGIRQPRRNSSADSGARPAR